MNVSRAEYAALQRKRGQPVKAEGELLAVWVPGKLVNTKNARWYWRRETEYKQQWKERVALALLECGWMRGILPVAAPSSLKHVSFLAHTRNAMDTDGLEVALAPVRDALAECGVITGKRERAGRGDAPRDGHEFTYTQRIDRTHRGVEIRVSLRPAGD